MTKKTGTDLRNSNVHGQEVEGLRSGVQIDLTRLGNYIIQQKPDLVQPFTVKQFKLGQSNPTFLMADAKGRKLVIRKKPPGSLLSKTAHAIEREYTVLKALKAKTDVPVPTVYFLCQDSEILGTPFYSMEFLNGRIFADGLLPTIPIGDRRGYYHSIVKSLVKLHSVNHHEIGLSKYGRDGGYYERQLQNLYKLSKIQGAVTDEKGEAVGDLYKLPEIMKWLTENQVEDSVSIVHGDFKTDNIVFHPDTNEVIGFLDWELSTIGHPLSDLASLLLPWYIPSKFPPPMNGFRDLSRPLPIPEAEELIQLYCQSRNIQYPIKNWNFCIAFAFFRFAVICQGIAARIKRNQASSSFASVVAQLREPSAMMVYQIGYMKNKI